MANRQAERDEPEFLQLRTMLRKTMLSELEKLPTTLEKLEPKARIELIVKIMPFIFPRCDSIGATAYERFDRVFE